MVEIWRKGKQPCKVWLRSGPAKKKKMNQKDFCSSKWEFSDLLRCSFSTGHIITFRKSEKVAEGVATLPLGGPSLGFH